MRHFGELFYTQNLHISVWKNPLLPSPSAAPLIAVVGSSAE